MTEGSDGFARVALDGSEVTAVASVPASDGTDEETIREITRQVIARLKQG